MKIKQNTCLLAALILTSISLSCKKWIEVTPKTQVESSRLFSNRQGYVEALNGIYIKMVSPQLYGREMTFGMVDVLGRIYPISSGTVGSVADNDLYKGEYQGTPYARITTTWTNIYNAIANLNNLLENIEGADKSMFNSNEYDIIKGEALGLRAFLHFDMLRLFTQSYRQGAGTSAGIPYVVSYAPTITARKTVKDAMESIINDLKVAEDLLKVDPIASLAFNASNSSEFDLRKTRFNFYAVKATLARAYLWKLDEANALTKAEELIAIRAQKFPFVTLSAISSADESARDRVFPTEQLFGLTSIKLRDNYAGLLDTANTSSTYKMSTAFVNEIYENINTDFRRQYLIRDLSADPLIPTSRRGVWYGKLFQPSSSNRMPLIKIPEMYYIAAECLVSTNPQKSIEYLNTIRAARGLANLGNGLNASAILDEIRKEYRKEMPLEGQVFYFYKRLNFSTVPGFIGAYPIERFVLPFPQQEIDFGN